MSIAPLGPCQNCKSALVVEFIARMSASDESNYGVSWICPTCKSRALDVCPVGPVIPAANGCLNCGSPLDADARCSGCGTREVTALAWFGIGDGAPLDAANRDLARGLIRRALGRINHLLRDDPGAVDGWRFKARVYDQLRFHATSARMLRHAAAVTRTPALLLSAAFSLQELGQHDAAVEVYREFLASSPDGERAAMAWCNLGNSLSARGSDAEAERAIERAIELEPARATYTINHYALLSKLGRSQDAIAALQRGLRAAADPTTRVTLQRALAHAHAELGNGAAARAAAEAALVLDPASTEAWYVLGRAHGLLGNLTLAIEAMKHVLTLDPNEADALRALGMLERAVAGGKSPGQ